MSSMAKVAGSKAAGFLVTGVPSETVELAVQWNSQLLLLLRDKGHSIEIDRPMSPTGSPSCKQKSPVAACEFWATTIDSFPMLVRQI
jgi:hypothetical protein